MRFGKDRVGRDCLNRAAVELSKPPLDLGVPGRVTGGRGGLIQRLQQFLNEPLTLRWCKFTIPFDELGHGIMHVDSWQRLSS